MDFTKITPIEFNGQRVATTSCLAHFLMNFQDENFNALRKRVQNAKMAMLLAEGLDYFRGIARGKQPETLLYTKSGVLKLSNYHKLAALKDFAAQYFDTDALPAAEPAAITEVEPVELAQPQPDVTDLIPVEWSAQRVLTSEQLAQFYQCSTTQIKQNFNNNKGYFTEGKHYYKLEGDELKTFKSQVEIFDLPISKFASALYLWTREGAVRHCKMLNTVKAWEMFNLLEDNYFNTAKPVEPATNIKPTDLIKEIGETKDAILAVYTGAKIGIVLAQATNLVGEYYHRDLSALQQLLPPADYDTGYLTPTKIGEILHISAQLVNIKLSNLKFQIKIGKEWRLTDEGKKYAEEKPYMRNGHSGYQILWTDKVIPLLTEAPDPLPTAEEMDGGLFTSLKEVK